MWPLRSKFGCHLAKMHISHRTPKVSRDSSCKEKCPDCLPDLEFLSERGDFPEAHLHRGACTSK